jgi:drug/metabolite transporter (DMT)-like permease
MSIRRWFSPRRFAEIALIGVAVIWGATFFMVKNATADFSVLAFLALRFTVATLAMLPLAIRFGRWPTRTEWQLGIAAGALLGLSYISQTFALRVLGAGRTGFLTGLYVVIVPFLALILLRHPITRRIGIGAALAVIGLALLSGAPGGDLLGDVLALLCGVLYALQILIVERFPTDSNWRLMTPIQLGVIALLCGGLLPILSMVRGCDMSVCSMLQPFAEPLPTVLPIAVLGVAVFTGLAASSMAFSVQVWAQRILPPSEAALIYALESPFSAIFGIVFLGETLTIGALIGSGLMLAGMVISSLGSLPTHKAGDKVPSNLSNLPDLVEASTAVLPT